MPSLRYALDQPVRDRLTKDLNEIGFTCLKDSLDPEFLERCREAVKALIANRGNRFFSIIQPQHEEGSVFREIAEAPEFIDCLRDLTGAQHSIECARDSKLYSVLRVIAGQDATKGSFEFHYDASVITVLMPIIIPSGRIGTNGELIALPNMRKYRKSSFLNIVEKVALQNPISYRFYKRRFGDAKRNVEKLEPGSLYFFNGYRTFHGNLPFQSGQNRATLIFHFGDPHAGDVLPKLVLKARKFREQRRLNVS